MQLKTEIKRPKYNVIAELETILAQKLELKRRAGITKVKKDKHYQR